MKTVVISAGDDNIAKLLTNLAQQMGLKSFVLNDKKKEDIALIHAIDEGMKSDRLPVQSSYDIIDKLLG